MKCVAYKTIPACKGISANGSLKCKKILASDLRLKYPASATELAVYICHRQN
jgi:hypothetical protein